MGMSVTDTRTATSAHTVPRHPSLWKALMTSKSCGGCLKDLPLKLDAHTRLEAV